MKHQRHRRLLETAAVMALLATVPPWLARKLSLVHILMTINATRKLHPVQRLLACRLVARFALHIRMRHHQRKSRLRMIGHLVRRRLEAVHRVTALALATISALGKLSTVRIRLMAISAKCMRYRTLEISRFVARQATHFAMLAQQRVLRLRVIKSRYKRCLHPATRAVATIATLLELTLVHIVVARRAISKLQSCVSRLSIAAWRMALRTRRRLVHPRQRIARL